MEQIGQPIMTSGATPKNGRRIVSLFWALLLGSTILALILLSLNSVVKGAPENTQIVGSGASLPDNVGTIRGQKWLDADGDGVRDPQEFGIPDWPITIESNGFYTETKTDIAGFYEFTDLPLGEYVVEEVMEAGWLQTYPPSMDHTITVTLPGLIEDVDFGNQPLDDSGFHGMKFNDLNGNGRRDEGESGIPAWTIQVSGDNGLTKTAMTDIQGRYWFMGLPTGTYTISEQLQDGWTQTAPLLPGGATSYVLQLPGTFEHLDFGNHRDSNDGIHGMKWYDLDGDGVKDPGEPGIPGWAIAMFSPQQPDLSQVAFTDAGGHYWFVGMPTGVYTVAEIFQPGWLQTWPPTFFYNVRYDAGSTIEDVDFGNRELNPGGIHGLKFADRNANGRRDDGEPGLAGWQIDIQDAATMGAVYSDTTVTDVNGHYWFMGVPAGKHVVFETTKDGWEQTFPPFEKYEIIFVPGQPIEGVNFGNYRPDPGSIHGQKFDDQNGNGRRDAGEAGLSGWQIHLSGETVGGASIISQTVTGTDGRYWFMDVPEGVYQLAEVPQDSWFQTFPKTGSHTAIVGPGLTLEGLDFGNGQPPLNEIHGLKFHDKNGNGRRDLGEGGLSGWTIVLESSSGISVTKTGSDGRYRFANLPPDTYYLSEVQQDGWQQTTGCTEIPAAKGEPPKCRFQWGEFLSFNAVVAVVDFGNWQPGPGSIHGLKWHDANGNGRRDDGEPGLAGWTIFLRGKDTLSQTTTGPDGRYWFMGLKPGEYQLRETPKDDWVQTFPMNNAGHSVFLEQGETIEGVDFGNWDPLPAEIQGLKFDDRNGNGRKDAGEPGLSGWTIVLIGLTSKHEATTGATGEYEFLNLRPGPYLIYEEAQAGWLPTTPEGGFTGLRLDAGAVARVIFGNWRPAPGSIGGTKWHDLDGDGSVPDGQFTLAGVMIRSESGDVQREQLTGENGQYSFTGLPPGRYHVTEVITPGWQQTFPISGGHVIDLSAGTSVIDVDFGNWKPNPSQIHGLKWHDLNGDGVRDDHEPAIPNWKILIISEDGDSQETKTDEDGRYWFMDLLPGKYVVREVVPDGWQQTYPETRVHTIFLAPNQIVDGVNFGNWRPETGSIHGQKFEDVDGDGRKDPDEFGLAGWVIYMVNELGQVRRTMTDEKGNYAFEDISPGKIKVFELLKYGWRQTMPMDGGHEIDLAPGQAVVDIDFGNKRVSRDYCLLPSHSVSEDKPLQLIAVIDEIPPPQNSDVQLEVEFFGLPAGSGANADGPEEFEILASNPFSVEVGSFATLEFKAQEPFSFTEGFVGPAIFAANVTNLTTGESFGCSSMLWPSHPDFLQLPQALEPFTHLRPGDTTFLGFTYEMIGDIAGGLGSLSPAAADAISDTVTISYTFSAASEGLEGALPGITLNGLPAGNNVQGIMTVPMGISDTLGVLVGFAEKLPSGPSDIILELDIGADGTTDAVTSAAILPPLPPEYEVYIPLVIRE